MRLPKLTFSQQVTQGWIVACLGAAVALCLLTWHDGAAWTVWCLTGRWRVTTANVPAWRTHSAPEWGRRARQHAEDGNFRFALGAVNYALAWSPDDPALLTFKGNMLESLFQFREAENVYARVLRLDGKNGPARDNLVLCQRINRIRRDPGAETSTLYGLHRVMSEQGRRSEDLAISRRLSSDRNLWQTAWQAELDEMGLHGKITIAADGAMELDLSGEEGPDLKIIREFPVTRLNLARTGVANVRALRGMSLDTLDLTQTVVDNLAPLKGMPLKTLRIARTGVIDLSPVENAPLQLLDISRTRVFDLSGLTHVSTLTTLLADDTPINDIRQLAWVPLTRLSLVRTRVHDLTPLSHLPLQILSVAETPVDDLTPLKGSPLEELYLSSTLIKDLSPLAGMPLRVLTLSGCDEVTDLRPLSSCTELEHLLLPPRPMFLKSLTGLPRLQFMQHTQPGFGDMLL